MANSVWVISFVREIMCDEPDVIGYVDSEDAAKNIVRKLAEALSIYNSKYIDERLSKYPLCFELDKPGCERGDYDIIVANEMKFLTDERCDEVVVRYSSNELYHFLRED